MSVDTQYLDWVAKFKEFNSNNDILTNEFMIYLYRLEYKIKEEYKSELLSCCNDAYIYFHNKNYYTNTDLKTLIEELKINIISNNWWSIFYNVQRIFEISTDIIIKNIINRDLIDSEYLETYRKKIIKGTFSFNDRILILQEVKNKINKNDLNIYIDVITVLNRLRNKYMFHHNNYDTLSFMFKNINKKTQNYEQLQKEKQLKKDKLLSKLVNIILKDIEILNLRLNKSQSTLLKLKKEFDAFYVSLKQNIDRNNEEHIHCNYY